MREIIKDWKNGVIHPIYLFYGEESFLIEEAVDWMKKNIQVDPNDMGQVIAFDLEEVSIETLIQEVETPSFFGGRRLVIGKNATFLTTKKNKGSVSHNLDALLEYLKQPYTENTLLLIVANSQLDKRKKIVKELLKLPGSVEYPPLKGKEVIHWLLKRFHKFNVQIAPEVAKELAILIGNDLRLLHQECAKLATYVGPGGVITNEIIYELVPRTLEQDVFQLTEKLALRQLDEALRIWDDLLQQKEEPIRILALITRQIRLMLQVKLLKEKNMTEKEMASYLQMHPYPVKLALKHGNAFSKKELCDLLATTLQADVEIKSGKADKVLAIEQILFSLSH